LSPNTAPASAVSNTNLSDKRNLRPALKPVEVKILAHDERNAMMRARPAKIVPESNVHFIWVIFERKADSPIYGKRSKPEVMGGVAGVGINRRT
jgi:hypothetical protein